MSISARSPFDEPDDSPSKWVIIFVLLSLLAHVVIVLAILLITHFMPVPKLAVAPLEAPKVHLSLIPAPAEAPKHQPIFVPTKPDAQAQHKEQEVQSANDTDLKSRSTVARDPNSIMPDVNGREHNPNLNQSPLVQAPPKPQVSSTPPTPRQATPKPPAPTTPDPQTAVKPLMPHPKPSPLPPTPQKPTPPEVDPNTGLPVLPPISAQTMAPPDQASQPLAPVASPRENQASIHGALGRAGDNSPAAMATELGKYKQYVYEVVGSWWYPDIDKQFGLIGVGDVRIRYTIHSDGTIDDIVVVEGDQPNMQILRTISLHALMAPAPYKPWTPAMIKEVGDSYTDEFSFGTY